jgi:hypothetical protein
MTHNAPEEAVINAKKELESFDFISGEVMVIRVEDLVL